MPPDVVRAHKFGNQSQTAGFEEGVLVIARDIVQIDAIESERGIFM